MSSTNSFHCPFYWKRLRLNIWCRYCNIYLNADGLLAILFFCKEQEHMGPIVLIAYVSFLKIMKTLFSDVLEIESFSNQPFLHWQPQDNISFDLFG